MALGSITHSIDMNQRHIQVAYTGGSNSSSGVTLTAPENGYIAPPGYYMLFLLREVNGRKVPSIARIIKVGENN
jgi:hypothetical protein